MSIIQGYVDRIENGIIIILLENGKECHLSIDDYCLDAGSWVDIYLSDSGNIKNVSFNKAKTDDMLERIERKKRNLSLKSKSRFSRR